MGRRLPLYEEAQFYATVKELVQLGLDLRSELNPVAEPLAVRAIESMTGKRSGYTVEDVLVSIQFEVNNATPSEVIFLSFQREQTTLPTA